MGKTNTDNLLKLTWQEARRLSPMRIEHTTPPRCCLNVRLLIPRRLTAAIESFI